MTDSSPAAGAPQQPLVKIALAVTLALLAVVLVGAALSPSSDSAPRLGRRVELLELIRAEQQRTAQLEQEVALLSAQVAGYETATAEGADRLAQMRSRVDGVLAPAGMTEIVGPGVTVTLTDSSLTEAPTGDVNDLVIHEQDLQAVINAMWAGGAEAMSVNGQRILATTAIRCVGNTLLLHGGVYSPPYVVSAVGDEVAIRSALERDSAVERFAAAVQRFKLGYTTTTETEMRLPSYDGRLPLEVATPARSS